MKNFKKITALFVVFAMIFSLATVSVFADNGIVVTAEYDKNAIGQGAGTIVRIYATSSADATMELPAFYINYKTEAFDAAVNDSGLFDKAQNEVVVVDGALRLITMLNKSLKAAEKTLLGSFTLTAKSSATAGEYSLSIDEENSDSGSGVSTTYNFGTLSIAEVATINSVTAPSAIVDKELGTAVADLGLPSTLTIADANKDSAKGGAVNVTWDTTNYDSKVATTQKLNGTVTTGNDFWTLAENFVQPTIEVTLKPITDGTVAEAKGTVMVDAENGITEDTIKKALPATLDVSKGDFKDTFAVTWNTVEGYANEGKGYKADDVITVKGTLTSPSAKGLFTTTTTDVEGKVTVVPAEIKGGSISINNPIDNGYVTANITVPASEVAKMPKIDEDKDDEAAKAAKKAKRTVLVTVESKKTDVEDAKGEYEFTNDDIDKAIAAVTAATAEKPADPITVPAIKVDKKMKDLGYSSSGANKTFTVNVTVGGTKLLNGDSKDTVTGEVKKASSSSAPGINKGSSTTTTYAVTVVETKNGTATVSPEKAASGATVTVKPEPAEGYKVKSVTAVKADGTNVPVDEKAYTFTMPASAVKVTVEFEEGKNEPSVDPTPAEDKFADVADDFWAAKDIYTLKDAGIIGGKSATEFDPEGDVTRAEFAKMVVGLFGYKATSDAVNFEDCKAEDWFTPYVAAGVEAGVIKGVSDTEFAPNATITREDACTILGRALNKVAQSNELKFTDADKVAEYAAPYVALLSELGYVNGYEDGSFAPTNNITRAEAAKIIAGIYNAKDTTVTEDKTDAADTTDANVEGENTTAPVEENAEDKADTTDTIDVAPEK